MNSLYKFAGTFLLIVTPLLALSQSNSEYPNRPIKLIVPQAAGGGLDQVARLMLPKLSENLGQPVIIDNRGSAGGIAGIDIAAKASPDGYTLLMASATVALNTALGMKLPYDAERDFAPISLAVTIPLMVVTHPSVPYKNLKDIVEESKKVTGGLPIAIASIGTLPHLLAEAMRFKSQANLNLIFYKGSAPASLDALSGTVPIFIDSIGPIATHVAANKFHPIALTSKVRSPLFPQVPTVVEQGFPDLVGSAFYGFLSPAKTPIAIQKRINQAVAATLSNPEIREKLLKQGYEIFGGPPEEYASFMKNEISRWSQIVKAANIKVE